MGGGGGGGSIKLNGHCHYELSLTYQSDVRHLRTFLAQWTLSL